MDKIPERTLAFSDLETKETSMIIGLSEETKAESVSDNSHQSLEEAAEELGLTNTAPGVFEKNP